MDKYLCDGQSVKYDKPDMKGSVSPKNLDYTYADIPEFLREPLKRRQPSVSRKRRSPRASIQLRSPHSLKDGDQNVRGERVRDTSGKHRPFSIFIPGITGPPRCLQDGDEEGNIDPFFIHEITRTSLKLKVRKNL